MCQVAMRSENGGAGIFLVMYHGGLLRNRGIETLIRLVAINHNIAAVVLGSDNVGGAYLLELKKLANDMKISDRILFLPAVPFRELWKYVGAVDCGMILAPAITTNALYSFPNKLFENIQGETPVVCPHYPMMQGIVDEYGVGLTCDPTKIEDINACVEKMRTDKEFYNQCKVNLKKAKEELCWENEKIPLLKEYQSLMGSLG